MKEVTLQVNCESVRASVSPSTTLVTFLREHMQLKGTHVGCDTAQCGACTVLVDERAVKACNVLMVQVHGRHVQTIEGVATGDRLHPMQQAFATRHGLQCGFCTPGMVMRGIAMSHEGIPASSECIRHALCGNLCRCTGYEGIVEAIADGLKEMFEEGRNARL